MNKKAYLTALYLPYLAPFTLVSPVLNDSQCRENLSLLSFSECHFSFVFTLCQVSCFPPYLWGILWIFESEMLQGFFLASVLLVVPRIFVAIFLHFSLLWGSLCCFLPLLHCGGAVFRKLPLFLGREEMFFTQIYFSWHSFACLGELHPSIFLKFGWEYAETLHLFGNFTQFPPPCRPRSNVKCRTAAFRKTDLLPFLSTNYHRLTPAY